MDNAANSAGSVERDSPEVCFRAAILAPPRPQHDLPPIVIVMILHTRFDSASQKGVKL